MRPPCISRRCFNDGKAQPEPARPPGPGPVGPVEPLEDMGEVVGRDAPAGVLHGDHRVGALPAHPHADLSPFGRELQGVVQEVRAVFLCPPSDHAAPGAPGE